MEKKTILVVDDAPANLDLLVGLLKDQNAAYSSCTVSKEDGS